MKHTRHIHRLLLAAGVALGVLAAAGASAPATMAAQPTIDDLRITAGGHEASARVRASEEMLFSYTLTTPGVTPTPQASLSPHGGGAVADPFDPSTPSHDPVNDPVYTRATELRLTGLTSNTTYTLDVRGITRTGQSVTAQQRFTTLKQRVRITLDTITVTDDGDWIGNGEPTWYWKLHWDGDSVTECYPQTTAGHCREGSVDEGTITPLTGPGPKFAFILAEENFPTGIPRTLHLVATAHEADTIPISFPIEYNVPGTVTWQVPEGVERASQQVTMPADADGFRSTMTFTFELVYDAATYAPNAGRVHSTSR